MTKAKTILFLIAASLVVLALVGVTYAQYVNGQNQTSSTTQPNQLYNSHYGYCPPAGSGYTANPQQGTYAYRMGNGMCGRFW